MSGFLYIYLNKIGKENIMVFYYNNKQTADQITKDAIKMVRKFERSYAKALMEGWIPKMAYKKAFTSL